MKMKNFVLYPYNRETEDIVENRDMLKGYKLVGVISNKEDFILMNKLNGQGTLSYNVSGSEIKSEFDTIGKCFKR